MTTPAPPVLPVRQQRLADTLGIQTVSGKDGNMAKFIFQKLTEIAPVSIINNMGNIYITKGDAARYPCVVAHLDTVHAILPPDEFRVYVDRGHFFGWNEVKKRWEGVGGDDKVGIWIALEALRTVPNLKVAFFRDEEWGCQGSKNANLDFFKDVTMVLQADRKGNDDFVQKAAGTKLFGDHFAKAARPIVESFGYKFTDHGGQTDVMKLRDIGLEVASANMSAGYYEPHSYKEYVVIEDAETALDLTLALIKKLGSTVWEWKRPKTAKVKTWPIIPKKYRDMRYADAIVSGVCPKCTKPDRIVWDDTGREWWCDHCFMWLPHILEEIKDDKAVEHNGWSVEARKAIYDTYEQIAIQTHQCCVCQVNGTMEWSEARNDITCKQCKRTIEEGIVTALERTLFDAKEAPIPMTAGAQKPVVVVEPPPESPSIIDPPEGD